MKRLIFLLALVVFLPFVSANYWVDQFNWNDDFDDATYNDTIWEHYSGANIGGAGVSCNHVNTEEVGFLKLRTNCSSTMGNSFAGWSVTRTKFNLNDGESYRISFSMNASSTLADFVGLDMSNGTVISNNNPEPGGDGTLIRSLSSVSDISDFDLIVRGSSNNATLYNSTGDIETSVILQDGAQWYPQFSTFISASTGTKRAEINTHNVTSSNWGVRPVTPSNDTQFSEASQNLSTTVDFSPIDTFSNITFYVWYLNGSLFNQTFSSVDSINLTNIPIGNFMWNVDAVSTTGIVESFGSNKTFSRSFEVTGEFYNNLTTEGNNEFFQLNISLPPTEQISTVFLNYNNTRYAGSFVSTGDTASISRTLRIPNVNSQVNNTFFWEINYNSGASFNSTQRTQEVRQLTLDACAANTEVIYNFTMKDEETLVAIPSVANNTNIEIDLSVFPLGSDVAVAQFSGNFTQKDSAAVCINDQALNGTQYSVGAQIRYSATDYETEFYNIQNFTLTSSSAPQNIVLYPLLSTDSQEFVITFKDESFTPVSGALITITRKYVSEGLFRTVEAPVTDVDGQTIAHLVIADVIYTIQVSKNGQILATFDNVKAFCSDITIGRCEINLDAFSSGVEPTDFENVDDLSYTMSFDRTARTVTVLFNIPSGGVSTLELNSTLLDNRGNTTVCSNSLLSSSGTLTCTIPISFGNASIVATLTKDGSFINSAVYTIKEDVEDLFGYTGYIFLILLYMSIPLMLITTGPGIVIGAIAGLIFATLFNLFNTNNIIGIGSTILWFIIAGAIIVWKVGKRE